MQITQIVDRTAQTDDAGHCRAAATRADIVRILGLQAGRIELAGQTGKNNLQGGGAIQQTTRQRIEGRRRTHLQAPQGCLGSRRSQRGKGRDQGLQHPLPISRQGMAKQGRHAMLDSPCQGRSFRRCQDWQGLVGGILSTTECGQEVKPVTQAVTAGQCGETLSPCSKRAGRWQQEGRSLGRRGVKINGLSRNIHVFGGRFADRFRGIHTACADCSMTCSGQLGSLCAICVPTRFFE